MIQKIQSTECLKRLGNMTGEERSQWQQRVGEWLRRQAPLLAKKIDQQEASYQNPLQMGITWNDAECRAWHEGVVLMSALMNTADTWLPDMLYVKAAKRGIRQMIKLLNIEHGTWNINSPERAGKTKEVSAEGTNKATQTVVNKPANVSNGHIADGDKNHQEKVAQGMQPLSSGASAVPVRPKHIDQYVHLLPKKTQERAALVKGLLRDMDTARENARRLAVAHEHPDKIATWAKTVTALDNKLKSIYNELDSEWEKLVKEGKVGVDDFGNAYIIDHGTLNIDHGTFLAEPSGKAERNIEHSAKRGRKPMTEEEKAAAAEKRAAQREAKQKENDAKRLEALKKNLRDTRTKATPERIKQWQDNLKVLLALGGKITDSIRKAAEHYGIDIDARNSPEQSVQSV